MIDTVRLYFDATVAVATTATLGVVSGFAAYAVTGDRTVTLVVAAAAFLLTGIVLTVRQWRMARTPTPPADPAA